MYRWARIAALQRGASQLQVAIPGRWAGRSPRQGRALRGPRLWWPRRPLATLGRKSRQGRKAATVSIDAGAEVSRRGRHPSGLSKQQKRWPPGTAGPWRRPMPSRERDGTGGRGSNGIDRRGRRGQPAGPPPFWTFETTEALASWHCGAVATAHAIPGTGWHRGARQQRYRSTRAPRSAGGAATLLDFRNNRSAGLLALRGRGDGPCHPGNGMAPGGAAATVSIDAGAEVSRRGRHPSGLSKQQKRWPPGTAGPWRRPMPSRERDGTGGRGSNGIDRRGRRGQPAGPPPFWAFETAEALASGHCGVVATAHAIPGTGWHRG